MKIFEDQRLQKLAISTRHSPSKNLTFKVEESSIKHNLKVICGKMVEVCWQWRSFLSVSACGLQRFWHKHAIRSCGSPERDVIGRSAGDEIHADSRFSSQGIQLLEFFLSRNVMTFFHLYEANCYLKKAFVLCKQARLIFLVSSIWSNNGRGVWSEVLPSQSKIKWMTF